jgi:WD40 repeat protein
LVQLLKGLGKQSAAGSASSDVTHEQTDCQGKMFAFFMAISDNPQIKAEKRNQVMKRVRDMLKTESLCEFTKRLDRVFFHGISEKSAVDSKDLLLVRDLEALGGDLSGGKPSPSFNQDGEKHAAQGMQSLQEIKRLHVNMKGDIEEIAWNKDGSRLAAVSGGSGLSAGSIILWDTTNWTAVKEFQRYGGGGLPLKDSFAFLPDGSVLTSAPGCCYWMNPTFVDIPAPLNKYKTLEIFSFIQWNSETGVPMRYIPDLGYPPKDISKKIPKAFAVSRDGSFIAAIYRGSYIALYKSNNGSLVRTLSIPGPDFAETVAFSPDSNELAVGTISGLVHFFRLKTGTLQRSFKAFTDGEFGCEAIAYSSDGRFIATGKSRHGETKTDNIGANIWRVSDNKMIASLEVGLWNGMPDMVKSIAWSPKGNELVVVDDEAVRVWRIDKTGHKLLFTNKARDIHSAKYSPQGDLAVAIAKEIIILR